MKNVIKYLTAHINEFVPVLKKPYTGYLYVPAIGTEVYDRYDGTRSVTTKGKPFVVRGALGEERVISPKELGNTYQLTSARADKWRPLQTGRALTVEYFETHEVPTKDKPLELETKIDGDSYWALFVPKSVKLDGYTSSNNLVTANKPRVSHHEGDYVVCPSDENGNPNFDDAWVVNGNVFDFNFDVVEEWHEMCFGKKTARNLTPVDRGYLRLAKYWLVG